VDRSDLLNDAERRVWDRFALGELAHIGDGDPTAPGFDPISWRDRQVRGELIARLLLGAARPALGYAAKVHVAGASVVGAISVRGGQAVHGLVLERCCLDNSPDFADSTSGPVTLTLSRLPGFVGSGWRAQGRVSLRNCSISGELSISGAHINGQLSLAGTRLANASCTALEADGVVVEGSAFFHDGFVALGQVRLIGAQVRGQLSFDGAMLSNVADVALIADRVVVGGGMFCRDGFTADGQVRISGANIAGQLSFERARLSNPQGVGLAADGVRVDGDLLLRNGFSSKGQVRLPGAHIVGNLSLERAALSNPGDDALVADRIVIDGGLFGHELHAVGRIRLPGARIGGVIALVAATLSNAERVAMAADGLMVNGDMFCNKGFIADGTIRLPGARIGGQVSFSGARLRNPRGPTLACDGVVVDGGAYFNDAFSATGEVRLPGARIGNQISFETATLKNAHGNALSADRLVVDGDMLFRHEFSSLGAIRLAGAHVRGALTFEGAALDGSGNEALIGADVIVGGPMTCSSGFVAKGRVSLCGARLGGGLSFRDATVENPDSVALDLTTISCPDVELHARAISGEVDLSRAGLGVLSISTSCLRLSMRLRGLTYVDLDSGADHEPPARLRVAWLRNDAAGYHPQPFEQLAAYYRSIGHDRDARSVLLEKRRCRRRAGPLSWRAPEPFRGIVSALWRIPGLAFDILAGYGYVPLRAAAWFGASVAVGTISLWRAAVDHPTSNSHANQLLLALDATLPTSPLGIRQSTQLEGTPLVVAMILQVLGYGLALAVLPALSRALSRGDR